MGMAKKDLEQQESEDISDKRCWRCGEVIYKSDLKHAEQDDDTYLCSHCRAVEERMAKE